MTQLSQQEFLDNFIKTFENDLPSIDLKTTMAVINAVEK